MKLYGLFEENTPHPTRSLWSVIKIVYSKAQPDLVSFRWQRIDGMLGPWMGWRDFSRRGVPRSHNEVGNNGVLAAIDLESPCFNPYSNEEIDVKGYAEREIFNDRDQRLFETARLLVTKVPYEQPDKQPVRCHELARAIGRVLNLPMQDGKCGFVDHSWLWTSALESSTHPQILDVYCVGRLPQVQLVDASFATNSWTWYQSKRSLYRPLSWPGDAGVNSHGGIGQVRDDTRSDVVLWLIEIFLAVLRPETSQ